MREIGNWKVGIDVARAAGALGLLMSLLTGCGDPVVGDWESVDKNACSKRSEFTVESDLTVEGTIWIEDDFNQVCIECDFDGEVDNRGDGKYEVDIDFDQCNCNGKRSASADCRLKGDRLTCELDFGACGTMKDKFDKQK
jgi:hypothetical protein